MGNERSDRARQPQNRLVLIDGKSVFYRGYYAMGNLALGDGTPTGGVYGFAAIAMEIVKRLAPTKVVVAWDSKTSVAKRRALFDGYKAGRVKPGPDFYAQIPLLETLVRDLGWQFIELDSYEADDIIGTLAREANQSGNYETFIISSDLDMLQIVDDHVHMWRLLKGFTSIEKIDIAEIEQKYGIKKSQFLDLKSLKGDSSDNIPGVPGIGEKTAAKLLADYGTLDGIYEHLGDLKGATRTKLEQGKDSAYMSKQLAKIMFDAPIHLDQIPDFHFDPARAIVGLKKLQFNSLIRKFTTGQATMPDKPDTSQPPDVISWDIKQLMHNDQQIAEQILSGKKTFWDLGQAAFLLDPLARELPLTDPPESVYRSQRQNFINFPKLYQVYTTLDLPLIPVLYKMETKGMAIDRAYFARLAKEYAKEVATLEKQICSLAGTTFNVNSPIQLSEVLFATLQLPTKDIKKTTRGYSTGAAELEKLIHAHPIIPKIIKYRESSKLLGTYITPLPTLADQNGRIHTTFTQNVTTTGRLSSKDPNLQNIPVRTDEGKRIRAGFVAPPGRILVSADYSQFELRLAAAIAGDRPLIDDFNTGVDIHTKTAAEAFGIPMDQVTKAQRRAAKTINFGILYGMSAKGLADAANMSVPEAKQFIDNYFKLRAPIKQKLDEFLVEASQKGYVETLYGRRRPTPDINSPNFVIREAAKRAAENMPIQGTEADLMKRAMLAVDRQLPAGADLVMQVHDSLIVECDETKATTVANLLKSTMEQIAPELKVKLAVEVTTGHSWGDL